MPSPFTATFSDGQQITVDGKTFEYVLANNLFKNVTQGGGGGTASLSISLRETSTNEGNTITIDRSLNDLIDFTSTGVSFSVIIDGITASFAIVDSNTITAVVPAGVSTGVGKIIELTGTLLSGSISATASIEILDQVVTTLAWNSNGDTNGLFYYFGTRNGAFSNPAPRRLNAVASSTASGSAAAALDRFSSQLLSNNQSGSWWAVSMADYYNFTPNKITIRRRYDNPTQNAPVTWVLEATNDEFHDVATTNAATWTTILQVTNDNRLVSNDWADWNILGSQAYTGYRIRMTAPDSSGNNFLCLGEVELYGNLSNSPAPAPALQITTDGGVVSGSNILAIRSGDCPIPVLVNTTSPTVSTPKNSRLVAELTGAKGYRLSTPFTLPASGWTVLFAVRPIGDSIVFGDNSPNNQFRLLGNPIFIVYDGSATRSPGTAPVVVSGQWGLWGARKNSATEMEFFEWRNNSFISLGTTAIANSNILIEFIGNMFNASNFEMGEIILDDRTYDNSRINAEASSLAAKWL